MKINVGKNDICYTCKYGKRTACDALKVEIEYDREKQCITECARYEVSRMSRFEKPSIEDIEKFCAEKGYTHVDAVKFICTYEEVGWVVGKTKKPMKSWKSAVTKWEMQQKEWDAEKAKNKLRSAPTYDLDDYKKFAMDNTEI